MAGGWIKLHRKITEKAIWQDPQMLKLWLYCLIRANHTETEILVDKQEIKLQPGQFVTGRYALAEDYNRGTKKRYRVSPNTLWRWLQKFKEWGMLDIKSTNKYSVITIKNWHAYQQVGQQMGNKWATNGQQVGTDKNDKNDKEMIDAKRANKEQQKSNKVTPLRRRNQSKEDYSDLPRAIREQMEREARGEVYASEEDPEAKAKIMEELNRMRRRFEEKRAGGHQ